MVTFPGEKFVVKLLDILQKSGSAGFRPWQIKREGKANIDVARQAMLEMARTENDVEDIRAGRKSIDEDGNLISLQTAPLLTGPSDDDTGSENDVISFVGDVGQLLNAAKQDAMVSILQKELNIQKTVALTLEEASQISDEQVSDEEVDPDWFTQWRENAQNVSKEDMQRVWAKILAGEIKAPGRFSLRTLGYVSLMSQHDAKLIDKIAPFAFNKLIFQIKNEDWVKLEVTIGELIELEDIGIISGAVSIGFTRTIASQDPDKFSSVQVCHNKVVIITHNDPSEKLTMGVINITRVGREIILMGNSKANENYIKIVAELIKSKGFEVEIGDWKPTGGDMGEVTNRVKI